MRLAFLAACLGALLVFGIAVAAQPTRVLVVTMDTTPNGELHAGDVFTTTVHLHTTPAYTLTLRTWEPFYTSIVSVTAKGGTMTSVRYPTSADPLDVWWHGHESGVVTITYRLADTMPTGEHEAIFAIHDGYTYLYPSLRFRVGYQLWIPNITKESHALRDHSTQ